MNNFYVYAYLDPRKPGNFNYDGMFFNHEPIYIGKGKKRRYYQHILNYKKKSHITKNRGIYHKIDEIFNDIKKFPIIIRVFDNLNEENSILLEKNLIELIGRSLYNKGPLVNISLGNEGCKISGYKWNKSMDELSKIKISEKMKIIHSGEKNPMYGKKEKLNPNYGRGKCVYQYDIFGNLIKKWENSNILSKELNFDRHAIDNRCKMISNKNYKKYYWSYKASPDHSFIPLSKIEKNSGMYYVYSFSCEFIGMFSNIRNMSRVIKIPRDVLKFYVDNLCT